LRCWETSDEGQGEKQVYLADDNCWYRWSVIHFFGLDAMLLSAK
jgi:hypothetical protein